MTAKISVFENKNEEKNFTSFYTFKVNPIDGSTEFINVYFPKGMKVAPEKIKTAKNGKRYTVCDAELKTSKSGKVYYQVIAD